MYKQNAIKVQSNFGRVRCIYVGRDFANCTFFCNYYTNVVIELFEQCWQSFQIFNQKNDDSVSEQLGRRDEIYIKQFSIFGLEVGKY